MRYGVVLILYYLGGLRMKEIAHVPDCPIGMVKSRLHYGRELLRVWLAGEAAPRARSRLRRGEDGFERAIVQMLRAGLRGEEPSPRVRDALLRGATERMHAICDPEGTLARWRQPHPHPRLWREGDRVHAQSVPPDSARLALETRRVMLALV